MHLIGEAQAVVMMMMMKTSKATTIRMNKMTMKIICKIVLMTMLSERNYSSELRETIIDSQSNKGIYPRCET